MKKQSIVSRELILASTSIYRRQLLERLDLPFRVLSPDCDERSVSADSPEELALTLAIMKAQSVRCDGPALVIGSDQVVDLHGEVLGKPGTAERANQQLARLSGQTHRLITAVALRDVMTGRVETALDVHTLTMRTLSAEMIAAYVAHDRPEHCAGSYRLERRGIALFERIEADPETADSSAIVGLPLMKLCRLLRRFEVEVLDDASAS